MREPDARNLWCPWAMCGKIIPEMTPVTLNREPQTGEPHQACKCITTRCIAWTPRFTKNQKGEITDIDWTEGDCTLVGRPMNPVIIEGA